MYYPQINAGDYLSDNSLHRHAGDAIEAYADRASGEFGSFANVIGAKNNIKIQVALQQLKNQQSQGGGGGLGGLVKSIGGAVLPGILDGMGGGAGDLGLPGLSSTAYNDAHDSIPGIKDFGGWEGAGGFEAAGGFR